MEKKCSRCKDVKPLNEFYKEKRRKDGHGSWCKKCCRVYKRSPERKAAAKKYAQREEVKAARHRMDKTPKAKARYKRYRESAKGKATQRRYRERHPRRHAARHKVGYAVFRGDLPAATDLLCIECSKPANGYHHHKGYAKEHWLDVIPVCNDCHVD